MVSLNPNTTQFKIGIIGATGYTGEELLKVLSRHSGAKVAFVTSEKEKGQPVKEIFPNLPLFKNLVFISAQESQQAKIDLVFLCLPSGESAFIARPFLEKGTKIVDLGADFRFHDPVIYEKWYHQPHPAPELLQQTVYGLPEWHREEIQKAQIVGNPGCYPTSVLLALLPFIEKNRLANDSIIVDAKSGVSGAGKSPSKGTHYVQVNESIAAYKPGRVHRHIGEMEQEISLFGENDFQLIFTPHLAPMTRGIFSSIYVRLKTETSKNDLLQILNDKYCNEPFVHIMETSLPGSGLAANSNNCFLAVEVPENSQYAILFSAIDNLGKGASWQAVQNMNLMLGLPEEMGLM